MRFKPRTAILGSIFIFFLNQDLTFKILFIIMDLDNFDETFFKSMWVVKGITESFCYISS